MRFHSAITPNGCEKVFDALNLNILNHISNRNILFGYCEGLGYKDKTEEILIILDKLLKIGIENALKELQDLGVSLEDSNKFIKLTQTADRFDVVLNKIKDLSNNETYQKGISELNEIYSYLKAFHLDENKYILDIGIIRGQNYYTGTVFEAVIPSHPEFGTVCGGGRYDNLAGYYTNKKLPGVGLSIGLTRLFDLLDQNNMLPPIKLTGLDLQLIPLGETMNECINLASYFQKNINCEVNYDSRSFKAKMKEANKRQIPFIIIVGEDEVKNKIYSLKNMKTGEQVSLSKEDCLKVILNEK